MIKLDISYQLTVDETEKITREERERRRKIRFQQVREISKTNAARVRKAVTKTKVKELNKLINTINEDLSKAKTEKIAELKECYMQSISNIGHGQQLAARQDDPKVAKHCLMKHYKKNIKLRHDVALSKLHDDRVTKYVRENKHIISRKAALETEKERSLKIASLPVPEQDIFDEVKKLLVPARKHKTVAPHSQISYPAPAVVEKHDRKLVKDGHLVAQAQDKLLQEQQQQIKQVSEKQEQIQKERYQKALQIELLNRDSEKMVKEISFIQKKQTRLRQKNLAKIPKQVFLPPYKRQENLQNKQKMMEKDFEQIYVGSEAELKSDLNVLLEPHPPVETPEATDSLDLTLTSDQESIPAPTRSDHSTTMRDITNIPAAQKGREKSTLQSLFNRIQSQRNEWISGKTESLQYAAAGQDKTDKSDYPRSEIPTSGGEGSSDFPVEEVSASEPTRDGFGLIPSTDETDASSYDPRNTMARVTNVRGEEKEETKEDSEEIRQPGVPKGAPRALKLQQQIQQVMEQKKRIEEQRRKLEERLRNFDKDKRDDKLSGYTFNPQQATAPFETKESVSDSTDQTDPSTKETFQKDQTTNIQELLEHGRVLIQSSIAHIKDSVELHQNDSSTLDFLPQLSSTTLGKYFPSTFVNLPENISKVREYQKRLLQKHEEKLKSPLSDLETEIPSQNAVAASPVSESQDTSDSPLLLSPPSTHLQTPFDQHEELGSVEVGTDYSRIGPNIPRFSATGHEVQESPSTSKLEQLLHSFKTLQGLRPTSTEEIETKHQEPEQQLGWLNSFPDSLLPSFMNNIDPENILQEDDTLLPSGTDVLDTIGSVKPRQQFQPYQSGLLSSVPEKPGVPSYDVDLLNMLPEKDTESVEDSQRLSQFSDDEGTSFFTELLASGANGRTDTGYSSEHVWGQDLIKNASNGDGRIQHNRYSVQKQLSNIEKHTELLCQQLSASNKQYDRQIEAILSPKEETGSLATENLPRLQIARPDSAPLRTLEEILDQQHPPVQRSAFINGHFPHELSAIEEAESILMTSCRSDNQRRYSSFSPITTADRERKISDVLPGHSNNGDLKTEIHNHSNGSDIPRHSRQDFDPSLTSVFTDQVSTRLSSTGFPGENDSSRTGPFTLWQDTSGSVSGQAEDLGGNRKHSTYKIWREIFERSRSCENSDDDLNPRSRGGLSPASMQTPNARVNFGPLQCDPKSSETSSDEIKLPSVLPPESSAVLSSSHLLAGSESSLSEIRSEGSLSKELMDNHRDLSTFLSQLRLLALKNQEISINSLRTTNSRSDATQNIAEDCAVSITNKLSCNSVHSTADATVSVTNNATIPEADKNGEGSQSEISKFTLFHCSDKNVSNAATKSVDTTFDSAIINNITRQDSVSNMDSNPVLEASTPSISVPESSFDLGEFIAPLISKFKDRLLTNRPFRASSPIFSFTHGTKLQECSSSIGDNQGSPPKTAAQSLNTCPSLENLRTVQALSSQEPTCQNTPITRCHLPQTSTSTLSSLPLSHTTLYSSSDQSNSTRTNQICVPELPRTLSPTISQYSYSSSSSFEEIDTDNRELLATDKNFGLSDEPLLAPVKVIKENNLHNPNDQYHHRHQEPQQLQPIPTSAPSDSAFYSNPCNQPVCLFSASPPPSSIQVISQKSPGPPQQLLLVNGAVKDQGLEESSFSDSTSRSQCTVVMRKVSSKMPPPGHSTSSPSSSSSTATLEKTNKSDVMNSASFGNSAQVWSRTLPSKTASGATFPSKTTKSDGCHSSSSSSSLTQYSYSSSSSSSQEDLSTNSNSTVPNPSKGPAMCDAKIFFNPLSNGCDVISQERVMWGNRPETVDADNETWFSLLQEDFSTDTSNESPLVKHEHLPITISPIIGSTHSESSAVDSPDRYASPPLHFQQVMLHSTCKKDKPYHQTLPNPVAIDANQSSLSPQSMSTTMIQQSNGNNSSPSAENSSQSGGPAAITSTSSSTLSGLSELSLPSDIKQNYQVLLDQARTFMRRFKENGKGQNTSDSLTGQNVQSPSRSNLPPQSNEPAAIEQLGANIATAFEQPGPPTSRTTGLQGVNAPAVIEQQVFNIATAFEQRGPITSGSAELQDVDEAVAIEHPDPNDVTEIIQRHEISLKRFDSIFDQMQQSPVGILEEPDLSLVSSETLSNLEYGSS